MTRILGSVALAAGLLIAGFGFFTEFDTSNEGYLMTALLVITGVGLRLEAAIVSHHNV